MACWKSVPFYIVLLYTVTYCTMMVRISRGSTDDEDGFRDVQYLEPIYEHDKEIVLWQELKRDMQILQKSRNNDAKILARLQAENSHLKLTLSKLEARQHADSQTCKTLLNSDWSKANERLLTRMSRELENLVGNLNNCSETQTPFLTPGRNRRRRQKHVDGDDKNNDDDDNHLYTDVENLKQEISAIKLLEDEQFPALTTNLTEHSNTLNRLLAETEALGDKLIAMETSSSSSVDQLMPYDAHTEFEKMNLRISQIGTFANGLQEKVYQLSDKYKWYSFLVEHFSTELHIIKNELYKIMKYFYKMETPDEGIPSSSGVSPDEGDPTTVNDHIIYEGSNLEEGSGMGPEGIFVPDPRRAPDNLKLEIDRVSMTANDAYAQVHQLMARMNALEGQQAVMEKTLANKIPGKEMPQATAADNEQCLTRLAQFKRDLGNVTGQLSLLKAKLVDVNTLFTDDVTDLRKQLNVCNLKCDRAKTVADIVREHQTDHFTAIQNMRQQFNVFESTVKTTSLKLATLQSDLLNATLTTYKDVNKELQQDLHLNKLDSDMDKLSKKFNENQESLKKVFTSLKQKADQSDFKRISDDVEKTNEKLQIVVSLGENVVKISDSVEKLESQLPNDCSMQTVPAKAGVYHSGVYLIKPSGFIRSVDVMCDMETDGGYWTVIHRRFDGHVTFNRTWSEYESGFGEPESDYWLGNSVVQALTESDDYELRVDAWDIFGDYHYAKYDNFRVSSPDYALNVAGRFDGTLSNALLYHNGMRFSAMDRDLDASSTHCAKYYESGWWFSHCHKANLNGNFDRGMIWFNNQTQDWIQFKKSSMKIRPKRLFT